jgi:hypothetical protein
VRRGRVPAAAGEAARRAARTGAAGDHRAGAGGGVDAARVGEEGEGVMNDLSIDLLNRLCPGRYTLEYSLFSPANRPSYLSAGFSVFGRRTACTSWTGHDWSSRGHNLSMGSMTCHDAKSTCTKYARGATPSSRLRRRRPRPVVDDRALTCVINARVSCASAISCACVGRPRSDATPTTGTPRTIRPNRLRSAEMTPCHHRASLSSAREPRRRS